MADSSEEGEFFWVNPPNKDFAGEILAYPRSELEEVHDDNNKLTHYILPGGRKVYAWGVFLTRDRAETRLASLREDVAEAQKPKKPRQHYHQWGFHAMEPSERKQIAQEDLYTLKNAARQYRRTHRGAWDFKVVKDNAGVYWLVRTL